MGKYAMVDLGRLVGYDFYHLEHHHPWVAVRACGASRRANDEVHRMKSRVSCMNPNGDDWGLAVHAVQWVPLRPCSATRPTTESRLSRRAFRLFFNLVSTQVFLESVLIRVKNVPRKAMAAARVWAHRIGVARETVRGEPLASWPEALRRRWIGRDRGPLVFPTNIHEVDFESWDR
jgi:hypothetical protein